jgi:hypothetical protein
MAWIFKNFLYLRRKSELLMQAHGLLTSRIYTQYCVYPLVVRQLKRQDPDNGNTTLI